MRIWIPTALKALEETVGRSSCEGDSIDPELESLHEGMMTKGDGRRNWSLWRKGSTPSGAHEDSLVVPRHRLAKGEIAIEEFDETKKRLID